MPILLSLLSCAAIHPAPESSGCLQLLSINDVYRIEGLQMRDAGGLARVAAARSALEDPECPVLLLHGGDALSPSLLGKRYQGEQMVDIMNHLDGDAEAMDERMFVVLGNHEFDLREAEILQSRLRESDFYWLNGNVVWTEEGGAPSVAAESMIPSWRGQLGGVELGIFGLTVDSNQPSYIASFEPVMERARELSGMLREQGAELVIGLTHLDMEEDVAILESLGGQGPDIIVGGHDHRRMAQVVGERMVVKADAEAVSASLLRVRERQGGGWELAHDWVELDSEAPRDSQVEVAVEGWMKRHEEAYCGERGLPVGCLRGSLAEAGVDLIANGDDIRLHETNLGSWIADQARAAFPEADVAFINSGSIRLNEDIPSGAVLTRGMLEELIPFPTELRLIELRGETLQEVLSRSVEGWEGSGHWLQISGMAFRHDPTLERAWGLTLLGEEPRLIEPEESLLAVTVSYLVDAPHGDRDGYHMLSEEMVRERGPELKDQLEGALGGSLAPAREGRICQPELTAPCLSLAP